ncbi:MAG: T9SS type A sorting domain-containing protein, partial [Candidatus Aegiribacteria sp.]|nr:T9SS type A sorting domain-containing protein [Candidatus Aegiribacteria sp.]
GEYNIYLIKLGNETSVSQPESGSEPGLTNLNNFPNPFSSTTTIAFDIPSGSCGSVSLSIYDISGRIVTILFDEPLNTGSYNTIWDGRDAGGRRLDPGVYFCRIESSTFNITRQMILL